MDLLAFPPISALLDLAHTGLVGSVALLHPLFGASAAVAVIVFVTFLVRAALIPTAIAQAKGEQVRARLAPEIRELQQRFRSNPERLQREMSALYQRENTSPFAGCLPVLVQAPVVGVLYTVFTQPQIADHANGLLSHDFLGAGLGRSLVGTITAGAVDVSVIAATGSLVCVLLLIGELSRRAFRIAPVDGPLGTPAAQRLLGGLHYGSAVFALFIPLAAGLYLTVSATWTLIQRILLRRRYPLEGSARSAGNAE